VNDAGAFGWSGGSIVATPVSVASTGLSRLAGLELVDDGRSHRDLLVRLGSPPSGSTTTSMPATIPIVGRRHRFKIARGIGTSLGGEGL
jgi:hypothetical protein